MAQGPNISFLVNNYSISENIGNGGAPILVQLTKISTDDVFIDYATVAGGTAVAGLTPPPPGVSAPHYQTVTGTLKIKAGDLIGSFRVPLFR